MSFNLPVEIISLVLPFADLFSKKVWNHVQIMLVGSILATGKRTVTSILEVMGLAEQPNFQNYHRVLNRAVWSSIGASKILLTTLVMTFIPRGTIVCGIDDTISNYSGSVSSVAMITRLRLDAALYEPAPPRPPGTMGRPRLKGIRLPNLEQVLIDANTNWSKITLANWYGEVNRPVEITTGMAVWYHTGLPVVPIRWVLVRDPLDRFKPQALLCTNQEYQSQQILKWFLRRWQMEATFEEVRRHLGLETQRQWSDLAIARTTPLILGLFSLVTLFAHHLQANFRWTTRQKSWYLKPLPTCSDALALVRRFLWASTFSTSSKSTDMIKVPRPLFNRLRDLAIYAA